MGGAAGGEFASQISAEKLYDFLLKPGHESEEFLEEGFHQAHSFVRQAAVERPELEGMATTLVMARVLTQVHKDGGSPVKFQIGSVGDSRAYYHTNGRLQLVTVDQTVGGGGWLPARSE